MAKLIQSGRLAGALCACLTLGRSLIQNANDLGSSSLQVDAQAFQNAASNTLPLTQ
jgi:hypothetical protein